MAFGIGVLLALPEAVFLDVSWKLAEVHLGSAAILGTALALILTLSIVPAQRAADVFSTAILKLYARDRHTYSVFAFLTVLILTSLFFATNWMHGLTARYALAVQFVIIGAGLDALRAFYSRTLDLLVPATALGLVIRECERFILTMKSEVARLSRVYKGHNAGAIDRWMFYNFTRVSDSLLGWIDQLEQFSIKATARHDTQAALGSIATVASIGLKYADSRRDSLVVTPDFSGAVPIPTTDIGKVLNRIYESVRNICDDASRQPNEAVVIGCIRALGHMAAHAMTMTHVDSRGATTAPLAYSPVFYLDLCTQRAIQAGMEDALLTSIRSIGQIIDKISDDVDSSELEATAVDCLFRIGAASSVHHGVVVGFSAVSMMLSAAHKELRVRGDHPNSLLRKVLRQILLLVPSEIAMDRAGQRVMQTFPPYSITFGSNLPSLLAEVAGSVKSVDPDHAWMNPFSRFEEVSKEIVHHYRELAKQVDFEGVLLEKWVLDSVISAANVHVQLMVSPPAGAEAFLDTVESRLQWYIHAPEFFLSKDKSFSAHYAVETCGSLAMLGMRLLKLERFEAAEACVRAIASIGSNALQSNRLDAWVAADIFTSLEVLARAAEALAQVAIARLARGAVSDPKDMPDARREEYGGALSTRIRQLNERLDEREHGYYDLGHDPVPLLRRILAETATVEPRP